MLHSFALYILQSLLFGINYNGDENSNNGNENIFKQNVGSLNFQILRDTINLLTFFPTISKLFSALAFESRFAFLKV